MDNESFSVGISQSAKTFYHKASNGNVSIMRLATDFNWATYAIKCNRCEAQKFIDDKLMLKFVIVPEIEEFCAQHQHLDWQEYKVKITSSKLRQESPLPKNALPVEKQVEGRRFRGEDE